MTDANFWIGAALGMVYGMLFVFCSFAFFMRVTQQLRQLAMTAAPKSETKILSPLSVRRRTSVWENTPPMTHDEYIRLVNARTQPIGRIRTEQLNHQS